MHTVFFKTEGSTLFFMLQARPVGPRLLAIKFLETCVLLFMPDNDSRGHIAEGIGCFSSVTAMLFF